MLWLVSTEWYTVWYTFIYDCQATVKSTKNSKPYGTNFAYSVSTFKIKNLSLQKIQYVNGPYDFLFLSEKDVECYFLVYTMLTK